MRLNYQIPYYQLLTYWLLGVTIDNQGSPMMNLQCSEVSPLTLTLPSATIVILATFQFCAENIEHTRQDVPNWTLWNWNAATFDTSIPCQQSQYMPSKNGHLWVPKTTFVASYIASFTLMYLLTVTILSGHTCWPQHDLLSLPPLFSGQILLCTIKGAILSCSSNHCYMFISGEPRFIQKQRKMSTYVHIY